jgi:hypothetical protein
MLTTADDLQNLMACSRRSLPSLTPDELVAIAGALARATKDMEEMRKPQPESPTKDEK